MKKTASVMLLICLCLILAACGKSDVAQAAQATPAPVQESAAPTPEPTPVPTPEPVDLKPIIDELNMVEMEQRQKELPFVGVYELSDDGRAVIYKMAIEHFEFVAVGADLGNEEYVDGYNKTIDELPSMVQAVEEVVQMSAPDTPAYIYLMLTKDTPILVAIASSDQILYDVINGVGVCPENITPIIPPEAAPEASPAA